MRKVMMIMLVIAVILIIFTGCGKQYSEEENRMLIKETTMKVIEGAQTDVEKAEKIFYFIRDEIKFGWVYPQEIPAADVLRNGKGVCMQKANLQVVMMKEAGLKTRFHFMYVSKKALEDFLPDFAYNNWPETFAHTFPEVYLNGSWVSVEATIDRELHELCIAKRLNFGKDASIVENCSTEFSAEGVKGHQQYREIAGKESFYGESLDEFTEYLHEEIPWWKRLMQPLIFRKADKIINDYRGS
ncbi:MAG TPA: transglutaminase-like domain-containing protein [Thermotogota bacterium]|nr:transglutaminase-like domain-containing protein [Thermotogota bacterium]